MRGARRTPEDIFVNGGMQLVFGGATEIFDPWIDAGTMWNAGGEGGSLSFTNTISKWTFE